MSDPYGEMLQGASNSQDSNGALEMKLYVFHCFSSILTFQARHQNQRLGSFLTYTTAR